MNIFEQYGIKEVADVCLYAIELDENDDEVYVPVMYLDTLKISSVEETAEQTSARGGLGNPELIIWDYGKEITVTLEDALYSPASQGMTWGGKFGTQNFTLYGEVGVQKKGEQDTRILPCKFIVESFSDFEITERTSTTGISGLIQKVYHWKTNISVISTDGTFREFFENIDLYYFLESQEWSLTYKEKLYKDDILLGDIDQNGVVSISDIIYLSKYITNPSLYPLTEKGKIAADVNQDGNIDTLDMLMLIEYNMGVISDLGKYNKIYLSLEANKSAFPPQEAIYQIDHALDNVYYLDRIEKCRATQTFVIDTDVNTTHGNYRYLEKYAHAELTVFIDPRTMQPYEPNTDSFIRKNGNEITGNLRIIKQHEIYYKWTRSKAIDHTSLGHQIIVDAVHFPGTYRLVGETYSRSRKTGKDQRFQFEIPLCKMGTENSFTLEAEGDPTTFNMTLKVLRREDGVMMKLTQYSVENAKYDGYLSDSTNVIPNAEVLPEDPTIGSD